MRYNWWCGISANSAPVSGEFEMDLDECQTRYLHSPFRTVDSTPNHAARSDSLIIRSSYSCRVSVDENAHKST